MPFWDFLRRRSGRGRPAHEPKRDTLAWPNLSTLGQASPWVQPVPNQLVSGGRLVNIFSLAPLLLAPLPCSNIGPVGR